MAKETISAPSPEMICLNCRHYDTIWLNCKFLGFDGIRENPNMRCNVEITVENEKRFAFEPRTPEEMRAEEKLAQDLLGDDTVQLSDE
ncbi:MAG: hypothetical protein AB1489_10835 [Acidobacteriota bacterium]